MDTETPSTAEVVQKVYLSTSPGSSSCMSTFPIRAPPTVDSDTESSLSSNGQINDNIISNNSSSYNSDFSGFESEGFFSGEDEFETASERVFVSDPDENAVKSYDFDCNPVGFRPFVKDPYGKNNIFGVSRACLAGLSGEGISVKSIEGERDSDFGAESDDDLILNGNFVEKSVVFRPFVNDPNENDKNGVSGAYVSYTSEERSVKSLKREKYRDFDSSPDDDLIKNSELGEKIIAIRSFANDPCGNIDENGVSRDFVADTDEEEETSGEQIKREKNGDFGESSVLDIGISEIQNLNIPVAKLSRDSDEESLVFEDVENNQFLDFVRISDIDSLKRVESSIRDKVSADGELEEKDNCSDFEPKLDDKNFEKPEMSENIIENMEFQGVEIVTTGLDFTCFIIDETKSTVSTKIMDESEDFVIDFVDKNDSLDEIKESDLIEIDYAVKKDNLGEEREDGLRKSYDVFDSLLISTFDLEINSEFKNKDGYNICNSERSFSIDDYSNGSFIDDIEQTSYPNSFEESSKDFWSKTEDILDNDANSPREKLSEVQRKKIEKIKLIRANFVILVKKLGLSLEDPIASEVLYKLILMESGLSNKSFICENLEVDFDFSLNILVIGKTGVGKSATINSIFSEEKVSVGAFEPATTRVEEVSGMINGIKIRIFDTPGLRPSPKERLKVFSSIKRIMRKCPPDIILYVDRLDMEKRDDDDLLLLRSITKCFGKSIWEKTIITFTHAGSIPPDGTNGSPLSYDLYVAQRLHNIQVMISQISRSMLNSSSVSLVENHSSFQVGENGEKMLLNGEKWRPRLLLLCSSIKILSEANLVVENKSLFGRRKIFGVKVDFLPLSQFLSSLLLFNIHPKTTKQENENDQPPIFKHLTEIVKQEEGLLPNSFSIGFGPKILFEAALDDNLNKKVSFKIRGSEQLQIAAIGILSIANGITRKFF